MAVKFMTSHGRATGGKKPPRKPSKAKLKQTKLPRLLEEDFQARCAQHGFDPAASLATLVDAWLRKMIEMDRLRARGSE